GGVVRRWELKGRVPRQLQAQQGVKGRQPIHQEGQRDTPRSMQPARAAERARTTSEWLSNVILGIPLGVVVVDRRYDVQTINSAALRLLGIYKAAQGEDLIHLTRSIPGDALST